MADLSGTRSAHVDTFARDGLPPRELWPLLDLSSLGYPERLNAAVELLDRRVRDGDGERTVLIWPGGRWSYEDLRRETDRMAYVLVRDLGVVPGNRVLLRGTNSPRMVAAWFAVLKAGGICVATMPMLRWRELSYTLEKANISLALTDAALVEDLDRAVSDVSERLGSNINVVPFDGGNGSGSMADRAVRYTEPFTAVDTAADDVAIIAFTSGTTGKAKGTVHFHRDILAICDCFPPHIVRATPDDVFCGSPPLAFTFGLGGLVLFPMRIGASALLLEQASPPLLHEGILAHGASVCFTAPTAYRAMMPLAAERGVGKLRKCISAGEHLPAATYDGWRDATGIRIIDGIGSTEMLHIFISASENECRSGSTGRVVPGYDARVVDDQGAEVPRGTIGHLAVRGPTGCRYLNDDERQQVYVRNGWNLPGDSYTQDEDGWFWYQARTDDMIVSSGYKIAGPEVENVLLAHPRVQECGVVGSPDEERGQVVTAYVVLREGTGDDMLARELQDFVKQSIAPYKYPRKVEFVTALPRTETGKLQRFRLREAEGEGRGSAT